jgi:O-antigen/teichoic acid export membrane protein
VSVRDTVASLVAFTTRRTAGRPFFREFLGFGTSTIFERGSRLAASLVAAAFLGPVVWGYWFLLNLILQYGMLVHLGAVNGMNREVPAAMGRGDVSEAETLRRSAFGFLIVSYLVAALLLGVTAVFYGDVVPLADVGSALVLLAAQQAYQFALTSLKARTAFGSVSRIQFASALLHPIIVLPATWLWGLPGFILGQAVAYGCLGWVAARGTQGMYRPLFDWSRAKRLIGIGFPIMLVGVVYALFATADRWVVVTFMGGEALGHYALAIMAMGAVGLLPQVIGQQIYPRMAFAWAGRGDPSELRDLVARQRTMTLAATAAVCVPLATAAPWLIRTYLPAFTPGIGALLVTLVIPLVFAIGQGYGNVFNVIGLQRWYLVLIVAATVANVAVSVVLVRPLGLVGVALGSLSGFALLAVGLIVAGGIVLRRLRSAPPSGADAAQR